MPRLKLTAEMRQRVIGAMMQGAEVRTAARHAGVTKQAIEQYCRRHPNFQEEINAARDIADEKVVQSLYDQALAGNLTAMIFWLKNRKRAEWRDRYDHEVIERKAQEADIEIVLYDGEAAFPATTITAVPGPGTTQ